MLRRSTVRALAALFVVLAMAVVAWFATSPTPSPSSGCRGTARCFTGAVTYIVDGDTLDVAHQRIRLALVNTPETNQTGYQAAKDFTANMCPVGAKALVDEDDGQTGGSYGRIVAVVYCGGKNLNAELMSAGHAVILTQYCSVSEFAGDAWATACH